MSAMPRSRVMSMRPSRPAAETTCRSGLPAKPSPTTVSTSWPSALKRSAASAGRFSSSLSLTRSQGQRHKVLASQRRPVGEGSSDRPGGEARVLAADLGFRHACCQAVEHDRHWHAGPPDNGLAVHHGWVGDNHIQSLRGHTAIMTWPRPVPHQVTTPTLGSSPCAIRARTRGKTVSPMVNSWHLMAVPARASCLVRRQNCR